MPDPQATTYQPVIAVFAVATVLALARTLKCACVGGGSNVPLGFVSLTENAMMVAMPLWMSLSGIGHAG